MDAVSAIASCATIVLEMVKKYIDDPKRRLEAVQDLRDKLMEQAKEVTDAKAEDVDALELLFVDAIHRL